MGKPIVFIFLGSGLGGVCRYLLSLAINKWFSSFPVSTLAVNLLASFLFGLFFAYFMVKVDAKSFVKTFLIIGFCGGFSTFSTFSYDATELLKSHQLLYLFLYISLSLLLCISGVFLGQELGSKLLK